MRVSAGEEVGRRLCECVCVREKRVVCVFVCVRVCVRVGNKAGVENRNSAVKCTYTERN